jgi:hypothetical protein
MLCGDSYGENSMLSLLLLFFDAIHIVGINRHQRLMLRVSVR